MTKKLKVDPTRLGQYDETGIYTRAINEWGKWDSVDMTILDRESFTEFIRSRGPVSDWAVSIFYALFDYPRDTP